MDLTLLSPGSRSNAATEIPYDRQGYFQVNVDGQQVTFTLCCQQNQPRFSRDAIAEFRLTTKPVRRDQGTHRRHDGERHHEVRHEYAVGHFLRFLSR